jgi:hypothetical protein
LQARVVLKDAAYTVLGEMITAIDAEPADGEQRLSARIGAMLDGQIRVLRVRMADILQQVAAALPAEHARMLHHEYRRWEAAPGWQLINIADPCGT